MPTSLSPTRILATGALAVLVIVAWTNLAPKQLGGSVSYVITYGNSMEPRFHQDDLVVVRDAASYRKGDVVAYRSAALEQPVMHRVIEVTPSGYVTKGDNNTWTDTDRPRDADVIGKEWVHVPGAGKLLKWVADPRGAVLLVTGMALFLFMGNRNRKLTRRKRTTTKEVVMQRIDMRSLAGLSLQRQVALGAVGVIAVFSLLLALLSFPNDPIASRSQESAYEHTGRFSYSADAKKSVVYPEGKLSTGGPLFLKLIDEVSVDFDYRLSSDAPTAISGTARLRARLDGSNGWQQTLRLQAPTEFRGNAVQLSGTFDPKEIVELTTHVQNLTGVPDSYTFSIVPVIDIEGHIGGEAVEESFAPVLAFAVDGPQLKSPSAAPGESGGEIANPLEPTLAGSIKTSELATNRVSLLMLDVPVTAARKLSVLGLAASLLLLFFFWQRFSRRSITDEAQLIEAQYGEWLVPITEIDPKMKTSAVQVASMDALVRLADRYERVILHDARSTAHDYFVEEGGAVYRYSCGQEAAESTTSEGKERPRSRPKRLQLREERRQQERARLREELQALDAEIEEKETTSKPDQS